MVENFDPINLTQKLVNFNSVTPNDNGAIDFINKTLKSIGFESEILNFSSPDSYEVKNLFSTIGSNGKHFAFAGHTDVVPVGNKDSWKFDPFGGQIENGKIYGRGTEDMKGNIACFISATNKFLQNYGKDFGGKISYIITGDEEKDAINGTSKIMDWIAQKNIRIDDCVVGEPTSEKTSGDKIKIGRRGSTNFYITVKGIQGHTANAHRAENPIHYLTKILNDLTINKIDSGNEFFLPTSLQVSTIDVGNNASNVIPEFARATINIRFNNKHTGISLKSLINNKINEIINNNKNISYKLEQVITGEPFLTEPGMLTEVVSNVCTSINNKKPILATDGGTSDARFIKSYCRVLEIGIVNNSLHQVDEFVSILELNKLTDIYYKILF